MIAPAYRGRRGHPVGFSSSWGSQLLQLRGDWGARGLINAHPERVVIRTTDDPGVVKDIDQLHDLGQPSA